MCCGELERKRRCVGRRKEEIIPTKTIHPRLPWKEEFEKPSEETRESRTVRR